VNQNFRLSIVVVVVGALAFVGCRAKNAFVQPPRPEVTVAKPDRRDVTVFLGAAGRVEARDSVEIRARVSGFLESVLFVDGQLVKEGQQLFQIEPEPYEAAVAAAQANLSSAHASREIAQTNYDRRVQAFETKAVSEIDVLTAKADLDSAEASVLAAEAALTQAEIDLSYTRVMSPVAGRAARRLVSAGNLVGGTTSTLLTTVVVQDPIHVYFNVSERILVPKLGSLANLSEEDLDRAPEVFVELADGSRYPEAGLIDFIDNRADATTGTVTVRAEFPNKEGGLLPGLYGRVLIPDETEDAIIVPDLAVQRDIGGTYVLVVNSENKVESIYVELGAKVDADRIITSGLTGDENVIVNGLQRARPGIEVVTSVQPVQEVDQG
jgi:RND family efflux transporter MFP subunit